MAWDDLPVVTIDNEDEWELGRLVGNPRDVFIQAHLALLSDPSRPSARDALARLVAEKVGLDADSGLALTYCPARPPDSVAGWRLVDGNGKRWALCDYPPDIEAALGPPGPPSASHVSIRNLPTDRPGALTAIIAALWPA